jgi:hypothetical protein
MASVLRGDRVDLGSGTSNPSSPTTGQIYYNSSDKQLKVYNGTEWSSGGVSYDVLGTINNPASSPTELYNAGKSSGVYYLSAGGTTFKTYCLLNTAGGHWGLAYIIHNTTDTTDFHYDGTYWSSLGEYNVSDSNLDPSGSGSASSNVATYMAEKYSSQYVLITYRYRDGNYNNYLSGSATNSTATTLPNRTSAGSGFTMSVTGTDHNSMVYNTASSATSLPGGPYRHNEFLWNVVQSGYTTSGGSSRSRFGQARAEELYNGSYYSEYATGIGIKASKCSTIQASGGKVHTRHSAGGCGDGPSATHVTSQKMEIWLR